jgi:hypothetical protein
MTIGVSAASRIASPRPTVRQWPSGWAIQIPPWLAWSAGQGSAEGGSGGIGAILAQSEHRGNGAWGGAGDFPAGRELAGNFLLFRGAVAGNFRCVDRQKNGFTRRREGAKIVCLTIVGLIMRCAPVRLANRQWVRGTDRPRPTSWRLRAGDTRLGIAADSSEEEMFARRRRGAEIAFGVAWWLGFGRSLAGRLFMRFAPAIPTRLMCAAIGVAAGIFAPPRLRANKFSFVPVRRRMRAKGVAPMGAGTPARRHPGLVPGSTVRHEQGTACLRHRGCRNESGMTD